MTVISARAASPSRDKENPFAPKPLNVGAFMGSLSNRSSRSGYTARLAAHDKTYSPSGRFHPDPIRRAEKNGETLKKQQKRLLAEIHAQQERYGGKDLATLAEEAKKAKSLSDAGAEEIATVRMLGEKEREAFRERSKFFLKESKLKSTRITPCT